MSEPEYKRGRTHNAQGTREAILNAAEEVFAEHGFDGARIDAIAAAAKYNKSLIFQYFGDKLNLYAEVIRRADDQTRDLQTRAFAALLEDETITNAAKLKTLFREFLTAYFDYLVAHPRIVRIYLWEMAEGWQTYSKIITQHELEEVEEMLPFFQKLQSVGLLRPNIDPVMQITMSVFFSLFYLGLVPMHQIVVSNTDLSSAEALAQAREYIADFVIQGMMAGISDPTAQAKK